MMGLLMPILYYAMGTWNYVASCRSSSAEGASDVSPFIVSRGVFQVSVEGHWTYSWTYVLVLQVFLRLFNLDCRCPRDLLQPARKKKITFHCFTLSFLHSGVSLVCLCVFCFVFVGFGCFVFLECLETFCFWILQQLDDRPCFIARSATRKKKIGLLL